MNVQPLLDKDERVVKVPDCITINTGLAMRVAVAHELEPILRPVLDLIVFPSRHFQHLKEMEPGPRINGRYRAVCLAILEPRATCWRS